jgi:hypothetical protein
LEVDDEAHPSTQTHGTNQGKTPPNLWMKNQAKILQKHKKEKCSIQLGDEIHTQRLAILIESNIYKV